MSKTFLAHVTGLSLCEGDGDGEAVMALVECDGSSGSVSWLAAPDEAPGLETVVRVSVEVLS